MCCIKHTLFTYYVYSDPSWGGLGSSDDFIIGTVTCHWCDMVRGI